MRVFAFVLAATLSFVAVQVNASALNNMTVPGTINEMSKIAGSITGLLKENDGIVTANANLMKKNKLWQEQLDKRLKPLSVPLLADIKASKAEEKRLTGEINRYNSVCGGTFKSKTPTYYKCMREKPVLDKVSRKHKADRLKLIKRKNAFDKEWASYATLINTNQATINKNFKRHLEIKDTIRAYGKTLEQYRTRLITLCAEADTDRDGEALHHCNSIQWDGTRKTLPPLDKILKGTQFFK